MHDLDIIHANLQTVRLHFSPTLHSILTVSQNNILVDLDGSARVAGLGSAFVPSQHHPTWSGMDAELLFYGAAPELVRLQPPASIRTTKESDVYAFALLAWEVSFLPPALFRTFVKPCKSTAFCRTGPFLGYAPAGSNPLAGNRCSTASTSALRTIGSNLGGDPTMLARQSMLSYANQGRCCYPRGDDLEEWPSTMSTLRSKLDM
jgi:hypothetical protein